MILLDAASMCRAGG